MKKLITMILVFCLGILSIEAVIAAPDKNSKSSVLSNNLLGNYGNSSSIQGSISDFSQNLTNSILSGVAEKLSSSLGSNNIGLNNITNNNNNSNNSGNNNNGNNNYGNNNGNINNGNNNNNPNKSNGNNNSQNYQFSKGINVIVTVDWEGIDLVNSDLIAIKHFKKLFPSIPLVHFMNAAYYTRSNIDAQSISSSIKDIMQANDEVGLHLHPWKSLIENAGVTYTTTPTLCADKQTLINNDEGFDVALTTYNQSQLSTIIRTCKSILGKNGFNNLKSFRAGSWLSNDALQKALIEQGFAYDHSAVPTVLLKEELSGIPVYEWLSNLWQGIDQYSQPYSIKQSNGNITEIPNNGSLVDYVESAELTNQFKTFISKYKSDPAKKYVFSIGFHQETAENYITKVETAIDEMITLAKDSNIPLNFVKSADINQ